MGYRCASCGSIELPGKAELVAHMMLVHNSPFIEGDPEMVQMSKNLKDSPAMKSMQDIMAAIRGV